MLCPECHGKHWILANGTTTPCPECGGIGEIHCCEGLTVQPECFRFQLSVKVSNPSEAVYIFEDSLQR